MTIDEADKLKRVEGEIDLSWVDWGFGEMNSLVASTVNEILTNILEENPIEASVDQVGTPASCPTTVRIELPFGGDRGELLLYEFSFYKLVKEHLGLFSDMVFLDSPKEAKKFCDLLRDIIDEVEVGIGEAE